jgi:predicted ATPase/DNA-binding SARP family transcriptional activator/DNA-binding CsgD family transcriptional regulator
MIERDEWRLRKAGGLVKLLALAHNHRLHREQVMNLLWPDSPPKAAANNLRQALHAARRVLGPSRTAYSYLELLGEQLALCPDSQLWVDVEAFEVAALAARRSRNPEAYRAAIELYSGDLLPEDRYEDWAESRREELRRDYLTLFVEMAELYEERRDPGLAVEALRKVVTDEPAHEEAHVSMMRLYAETGQRYQALRQYERLRQILSRELGTEPAASSRRLYEEILTGHLPTAGGTAISSPLSEPPGTGRHNLPVARTSFVGREQEIVEVKRALAMTRLLTLTGMGGSGKTRLALEVAQSLVGAYQDGVWLVELAPLADPDLVPQEVASAMGVREQPGHLLVDVLVDTLRAKTVLLVLDNCEHLADACARLVDILLGNCPRLRVLATSRETIGVAGETNWVVPPLSSPDLRQPTTVEKLVGFESVRLFLERVRHRRPDFDLTSHNVQAVAEICRQLDGIPLAIELAVARVGVLSVEQIAARLEDSLGLLMTGGRTATPRQRTLRATLDWSYNLLSEMERKLFGRLSVFAGGWTLEAAEAVCSGGGVQESEVLDLLSRLVDKSLVVAETTEDGAVRCRMLEPVRQYGRERLEKSGDSETVRRQHAEHYLVQAEMAELELTGPQQQWWFAWLEREHDNLRAALGWSLEREEGVGLRLATSLRRFWYARGHLDEGRKWLEQGLAVRGVASASTRAKALDGAGWLAEAQGDYERATAAYTESLKLNRSVGDQRGIAWALSELGSVALFQGDRERATRLLEKSLIMLRKLGNERDIASVLNTLGALASSRGDQAHAVSLFEEAIALSRKVQDTRVVAISLNNLGFTTLVYGDRERATALLEESLALAREIGDTLDIALSLINLALAALVRGDHISVTSLVEESLVLLRNAGDRQLIADCLERLAAAAGVQGRAQRAARLWGAAQELRKNLGSPLQPDESALLEPHLAATRSQLEEEAWEAALAEGRKMGLEGAIEYALSEVQSDLPTSRAPEQTPTGMQLASLTQREQEVALLVAQGLTNRQIATELVISEHTAATHVRKILKKLELRSRAELAAWVSDRALPTPHSG